MKVPTPVTLTLRNYLVAAMCVVLLACGDSGANPSVAVSVSPSSIVFGAGAEQTLTATVTNTSVSTAVTGSASCGTLTADDGTGMPPFQYHLS